MPIVNEALTEPSKQEASLVGTDTQENPRESEPQSPTGLILHRLLFRDEFDKLGKLFRKAIKTLEDNKPHEGHQTYIELRESVNAVVGMVTDDPGMTFEEASKMNESETMSKEKSIHLTYQQLSEACKRVKESLQKYYTELGAKEDLKELDKDSEDDCSDLGESDEDGDIDSGDLGEADIDERVMKAFNK